MAVLRCSNKVAPLIYIFLSAVAFNPAKAEGPCQGEINPDPKVVPDNFSGVLVSCTVQGKVTSVSLTDGSAGSIVTPSFQEGGDGTSSLLVFSTIDPAFQNHYDETGERNVFSVLTYTTEGGGQQVGAFALDLEDTNNKVPQFETTTGMTFKVPSTSWDTSVALNWRWEDALRLTDGDATVENAQVIIEVDPPGVLRGVTTLRPDGVKPPGYGNKHLLDAQLFLDTVKAGLYTLTATDGVNRGNTLEVEIQLEQENKFPPEFTNTQYFHVFNKMPVVGEAIPVDIIAMDPDNDPAGVEISQEADYLELDGEGKLVFKRVDDDFTGQLKKVIVTATEKVEGGKVTTVDLDLKFPDPATKPNPEFTETFYHLQLEDWPVNNDLLMDLEVKDPTEAIVYEIGTGKPNFISIRGDNQLYFSEDVTEETDGLGRNNVVMFQVVASSFEDGTRKGYATVVVSFPLTPPPTTTTTEPTTTTCAPCPTAGPTQEPCPSTEPTTPCNCATTEPPTGTTPTVEPTPCDCSSCPTTPPGISCPTTVATTPFDCSTCPTPPPGSSCPTTEASTPCDPSSCPTTPPGSSCPTTVATTPFDCSTCPTPPPGSSCPTTVSPTPCDPSSCPTTQPTTPCDPSSCPTSPPGSSCPTFSPPSTCPTTCEICECDDTTPPPTGIPPTSSATCPPCPCEQTGEEECSNTGLMVAVIITSTLCAFSLCAVGYILWLLRKANMASSTITGDNSFLIPKSNSTDDLFKVDNQIKAPPPFRDPASSNFNFGNNAKRFSFGNGPGGTSSGISNTPSAEPGFTNPSFTAIDENPPVAARRFSIPSSPSKVTPEVKPEGDNSPLYSTPVKKSNIKIPKEDEPDYEEPPAATNNKERKLSMKRGSEAGKQKKILFAPEDQVISIDGNDATNKVGGGENASGKNPADDSEPEYERL